MLIVLRENELCKISTRLRKNSKQSGIRAIDSWFDIIVAHQYLRRNKQREELRWKISSLSIRRFWGKRGKIEAKKGESLEAKSPSVKLMSRKQNYKLIGQNQPQKQRQEHAKITAYRINKIDLRHQNT